MKVAIITAGGAGMFCGSCMQDNTLARTLRLADVDAVLVPTYTPIRVDEENVSNQRVFLGGINVYLDSAIPGWRFLPRWTTGWLDRPGVVKTLSQFGSTDAAKLGSLTLDMLKGAAGPQQREVAEFTDFLCNQLKPDIVLFSNALLSGVVSSLKPVFPGKILCMLQGDDIFLEALNKRWKPQVMAQLRENCQLFDGFLTHTKYYQSFMSEYLRVSPKKFSQIPLTVDVHDLHAVKTEAVVGANANSSVGAAGLKQSPSFADEAMGQQKTTIGYFARICPEKGIQNLLLAAESVLPDHSEAEVVIAGYLPKQHKRWFMALLKKAESKAPGRIHWLGSPESRAEKFEIIRRFDHLCVPTDYWEPKGLYVLEAALSGVPSILPAHGAFPELISSLGTGQLYDPNAKDGLANCLRKAITSQPVDRTALPDRVRDTHGMHATAAQIRQVIADC